LPVRRPKSQDVAVRAGVSRTTVSFVLNDRPGASISPATRARVLAAAAELGYQPHAAARGLAVGRTHTLGLVLRQSAEQVAEDALLAETLRGLSSAARAEQFQVLVEAEAAGDGHYGHLLRSSRTDGLVVSGPRTDDGELRELVAAGASIVIQGSMPDLAVPSIDIDNAAAARVAVDHLIRLGHRRIACITNAPLEYTAAADRLTGYRQALRAAGIEFDPALTEVAAFDAASGRRQMSALLERADPTAVFVASDVVAFGAIAAIRHAGLRVPDDISVVGFDDIPLAGYFDPPLTTIRLPAFELGRAAGAALLDRVHGREVNARTVLPTELVIRSSTGPPRRRHRRSRDRPADEPLAHARRRRDTRSNTSAQERKESQHMTGIHSRSRPLALVAVVAMLVAACGGNATPSPTSGAQMSEAPGATTSTQIGGSVNVWTAWGGAELAAYQAVLKPFEDQTGITVNLFTDRNQDQDLSTNVEAGTSLPDIANPPNPSRYADWAAKGIMKPLESFLDMTSYTDNTLPGLLIQDPNYGYINGQHYLLMVKSQLKGLIWYDPKVFTGTAPTTWDEMMAIQPPSGTKLFCAAFESGAASGWPASDDLANIVMRQAGEQVYNDWYNGKVKWTDPAIKQAYQTFGQMVQDSNVYGGTNTVLSTNFGNAGDPLFTSPPGCLFVEQATFITSFFTQNTPGLVAGTDYNAFAHPKFNDQYSGNVEGFFDTFVMYNDTPQARALMQYMVTQQAQEIWVQQGGTLAANKNIAASDFKDPSLASAYTILQGAKNVLLTAGDYMPPDMQSAFWKSLLDFTNDQSKLDSILAHLDQVQANAYKPASS
jgi:DNA-binding LacI/PurR family transcriptional regulator/spermidine/putrescine-binding protein